MQTYIPKFIDDFIDSELSFDDEQREKLVVWYDLLCKWQKKINLVSSKTIDEAWKRHFMDSLQLGLYISAENKRYADLGSGAGFPGLALALISRQSMKLVESDQKKSSFLRNVIRQWGDGERIVVENKRIENITEKFDVVSARALAPLRQLLFYSFPLLDISSCCLFLKGENWKNEVNEAQQEWVFEYEAFESLSHEESVILKIKNIKEKV